MIRMLACLAMLLLAASAPAAPPPGVRVTVSRGADGHWLVDYAFRRAAPAWFFLRSGKDLDGKPWRAQSWTVETPGVRLERIGHYDVLVGTGAPLRHVRIRMAPFAHPLTADYTPALAFSDGGLALYTDHFTVAPLKSIAAAEALPSDLNGLELDEPAVALEIRDPGRRLLLDGKPLRGRAQLTISDRATYVYSGSAPVIDTPAFAGVVDPGLPSWVRTELDAFTPQLFALYAARLGPAAGGKPMAMIAWQGDGNPGASLGGSVLDGLVVMQISGKQVVDPNPMVLQRMRWFIGHESSHFWLGQTVHGARHSDSWIFEGGADLLAIRAHEQLVPGYDSRAELQNELDDCLERVPAGAALGASADRSQTHAFYSCGALLLLAAESVQRASPAGGDAFTFVRALIDAHRASGTLTASDWIAAFGSVSGDAALTAELRAFVESGVADPRAFWTRLFAATGIAAHLDGERLALG